MSNDYEEQELDDELIRQFSSSLESAINKILAKNLEKDPRLELLTTLMSFASQVAQDLGMDEESFANLATNFYQDTCEEPEEEITIKPSKKNKAKPN